ncbi:BMP family ABC transporter substrate-binding protein [Gryllotalpicola sp.]|uniref:putative B6 ABC transporter substrate-binding protein n=1 Tax=Gryllotalpicola sp. TaxID=1932787 RepID=UPI00260E1D0F|nr:BMP family ABC transporter substrate-binding protein [Gryllotalpicola sp.]
MNSTTLKRAALAAGAFALVASLAACSGRGSDTPSATSTTPATTDSTAALPFTRIAIVTPATEADHGWNQVGLKDAGEAAGALGLTLDSYPNVGYDDPQTNIEQAAKKSGVGFVIAHASGFGDAAAKAEAATGVPVLVTDYPSKQVPGKVGVITFSAEQVGYLAGVAAAEATTSKKLGIAISADDVNWYAMAGGFDEGAKSIDPSIGIDVAYISQTGYDDAAGGKKIVQQLIAKGDDVVFGMGDGATEGYISAINDADSAGGSVKYIADIGDVTDLVKNPSELLTSALWNFTPTYEQAIKDIAAGTFAQKPYNLDLANGGMLLQDTPQLTSAIKADVKTASDGIIAGTIKVDQAQTKDQLDAILKK